MRPVEWMSEAAHHDPILQAPVLHSLQQLRFEGVGGDALVVGENEIGRGGGGALAMARTSFDSSDRAPGRQQSLEHPFLDHPRPPAAHSTVSYPPPPHQLLPPVPPE